MSLKYTRRETLWRTDTQAHTGAHNIILMVVDWGDAIKLNVVFPPSLHVSTSRYAEVQWAGKF